MYELTDKSNQIQFKRFRIIRSKLLTLSIQYAIIRINKNGSNGLIIPRLNRWTNSIFSSLEDDPNEKNVKSGRPLNEFSMDSELVVVDKLGKWTYRVKVSRVSSFVPLHGILLSPRKVSFFTFAAATLLRKLIRIHGSGNVFTSAWIADRKNERIVCPRERSWWSRDR